MGSQGSRSAESVPPVRALPCDKRLVCGHECLGVGCQKECLPCLHKECNNEDVFQSMDSECCVCLEPLGQGSCLQLSCKHVFHLRCIQQVIQSSKPVPGARIVFGHCLCPLCQTWIEHPLLSEMKEWSELKHAVAQLSIKQANIDNLAHDKRVVDPSSPFFGNVEALAMSHYAFYLCKTCAKPFYGGTVACDAGGEGKEGEEGEEGEKGEKIEEGEEDEAERQEGGEGAAIVESQQRNCPSCQSSFAECADKDHVGMWVWKCRMCCEPATFFCHGSIHCCIPCHNKLDSQLKSGKPRLECPGPGACLHPMAPGQTTHRNGTTPDCEQVFRCLVCSDPEAKASDDKQKATPKSDNLVINPNGEDGLGGWTLSGQFEIEDADGPGGARKCWATGCSWATKQQLVDLARGASKEHLSTLPQIDCSVCFLRRTDAASEYKWQVVLMDEQQRPIDKKQFQGEPSPSWDKIEHTFKAGSYARPARFVLLCEAGKDKVYWGGFYGAKICNSTVRVHL